MNSFVVVIVLVSDVVGTAMVPLIIVGATSNKLLNVIDSRCSSARQVCYLWAVFVSHNNLVVLLLQKYYFRLYSP